MIRVAHLIQSAEAHAGGTTTAFLSVLDALSTDPEIAWTAYFVRPGEADPVWSRIRAAPEKYKLAATVGSRLLPGELGGLVARDAMAGAFDVLHIHGLWSPDLVTAAKGAHRAGVAYTWQSHGMQLRWAMNYKRLKKMVFLKLGLERALDRAHSFICMTRSELEQSIFPKSSTPERRFLIPLPISMPADLGERAAWRAEGRAKWGVSAEAKVMAFLGRLHPVKRVEMTVEAFGRAAQRVPELRLLLLGKGEEAYEAQLRESAQRLGVADRVIFAGWVQGDDKWRGLAAADALVLNSSIESFGYVLFEAVSVGTPVVISDNLALAGDFAEARAAIVTPNSVEGVADGMIRAAEDPDAPASALRARAWASETFAPAVIGAKLKQVYQSALAKV